MSGYVCVDADDEDLHRALGVQVVRISPQEVQDRYLAVADDEIEARRQRRTDTRGGYRFGQAT